MRGNYTLLYNEELNVPLRCVRDGTYFRFVASDVCSALEINPCTLGDVLPIWERYILPVYMDGGIIDCMCIASESIYTLCAVSTLNTANIFKKWFTEEVLPNLYGDVYAHNLCILVGEVAYLRNKVDQIEEKLG